MRAGSRPPEGSPPNSRATPPHIIVFPEVVFDEERFLDRVRECVDGHGYCVVVVSEGARYADGRFLSDSGTRDAFGHAQLGGAAPVVAEMIRARHGYKFHWAVSDYLQRAARHIASGTDVEQAYAMGRAAVELALAGRNAVMPVIVRVSDEPYVWKVGEARLAEVANVEKKVPRAYIAEDGFGITEACRSYLRPLIAGEDFPPFEGGLPVYVRLKNAPVPKKLAAAFEI